MLSIKDFIIKEQKQLPLYESFEGFISDFPNNLQNEKTSWAYYNENANNLSNEELWKIYINEQWNYSRIIDNERLEYTDFQNEIYETLGKSTKPQKILNDLISSFNIQTYEIDGKSSLYIRVRKTFDINNQNFIEILNRHNYFVAKTKLNDYSLDVLLQQWHGEEVNIKDYKYIYHITSKLHLKTIMRFGLSPKGLLKDRERTAQNKYNQNEFFGVEHPQRIYFLNPKTPKEIIDKLKDKIVRNGLRYKKFNKMPLDDKKLSEEAVLLKIDLSKCNSKIRFWKDIDFSLDYAIWTSEPIPPYAISVIEQDNETIWDKIKRMF